MAREDQKPTTAKAKGSKGKPRANPLGFLQQLTQPSDDTKMSLTPRKWGARLGFTIKF